MGATIKTQKNSLGFQQNSKKPLAPVVQTLDSTIHWINNITIQQISVTKTNNCIIHWIEICPLDSIIHLFNNWALDQKLTPKRSHAKFLTLKILQKGIKINDITGKIKTLEIECLCLFIHHDI